MQPGNLFFGGGSVATVLHPLVAAWIAIAVVFIFALARNKAIVPFLLAFFSTPVNQVVVLGGVHLTMHQILIIAVLIRMLFFRGKGPEGRFSGGFNALDRVVALWAIAAYIVVSLQWMDLQAQVKFTGDFLVSLGGYLAVRFLVPDRETIGRVTKVLALIFVIQGVCMVSELFTSQNVFAFAGAVPPTVREGHVRAEGALGGLYGGPFAAISIPLFVWLWSEKKSKMAAIVGIIGSTAVVFASHASTSWMAYGAALLGLAFWPLRKMMRLVRWGIVGLLVALHLVMHGPVWSLIEKIDLTGGSSNYHRYMLVDNCIRHFGDWWLLGCTDYGSWGFDMWDLCNQFVAVALTGGLISLVLFIMIFSRGFAAIGKARKQVEGDVQKEWYFWCIGSTFFSIAVASFGINYMVHLQVAFFAVLACVSAATYANRLLAIKDQEHVDRLSFSRSTMPAGTLLPLRQRTIKGRPLV